MHVILLSHEYPPFIFGGVGTFVKNLAHGLSRHGIKVTVISGYPAPCTRMHQCNINQESKDGITVLKLPYPNIPPRHSMFQMVNFKRLYKTVENINADVIHGQGGSTFPALLNLRHLAPIVVTFHSSPTMEMMMSLRSLTRGGSLGDFWTYVVGYPAWSYTFRRELQNSDKAVAVSKTLMLELVQELGERESEKICEIHNGIDIETLDMEYASVGHNEEEYDDTILFAGRLFWRKGALNLIKLAHLFRKEKLNFKVIVHGEGPLFGRMKKEIQTLGLANVELKGFTNRAQLMKSMKRCKFVLIPSLYEACPMILLESMCLGKIPVMFNLPYSLEFTENGKYGIIAKDPKDMVKKLKTALVESNLDSFCEKSKDFARRKYDIKNTASRYLDVYKAACN